MASSGGGPSNNATFQTGGGGSPSGLVLDLSKVTQVNQSGAEEATTTTAYRERMVPGSDDGSLQTFAPVDAARFAAFVRDSNAEELLRMIAIESRRQTLLLVRLFNTTTTETVDITELDVDTESE